MKQHASQYSGLVFTVLALLAGPATAAQPLLVDGVAAHVNEHTITIGDVMAMIIPVRRQLMSTYAGAELQRRSTDAYNEALQTLIARRLIVDLYDNQERIKIPEWLVDARVEEIQRDMFSNSRAALLTALSKDNLSYDGWRAGLHQHMVVSYMRRYYVEEKIDVSPVAVRQEYENNIANYQKPSKIRLRMIVMGKGPSAATAAAKRVQAEEVRSRALAGSDFGALARDVSEGGKAADGGDWGWIEPRMLRAELADAVADLKPAEVSRIVELADEFYLLKLEGRQNETVRPFEDVQPEIERELRKVQSEKMYKAWIERLKSNAYVEVLDIDPFAQAGA